MEFAHSGHHQLRCLRISLDLRVGSSSTSLCRAWKSLFSSLCPLGDTASPTIGVGKCMWVSDNPRAPFRYAGLRPWRQQRYLLLRHDRWNGSVRLGHPGSEASSGLSATGDMNRLIFLQAARVNAYKGELLYEWIDAIFKDSCHQRPICMLWNDLIMPFLVDGMPFHISRTGDGPNQAIQKSFDSDVAFAAVQNTGSMCRAILPGRRLVGVLRRSVRSLQRAFPSTARSTQQFVRVRLHGRRHVRGASLTVDLAPVHR